MNEEQTAKIPTRLPSFLCEQDKEQVKKWMATRPARDIDNCVNSVSRWEWTYVNHGIWSDIRVRDRSMPQDENSQFKVDPGDGSDW